MIQKIDEKTSAILAFGAEKNFSNVMEAYLKYHSEVTRLIDVLCAIYFPPKRKKKEKQR